MHNDVEQVIQMIMIKLKLTKVDMRHNNNMKLIEVDQIKLFPRCQFYSKTPIACPVFGYAKSTFDTILDTP